ncbi:TetR-like C-terminal domain-containing protein [Streptomyces sp. MZ04]|uniref:TetR-like C-terminal domain-containing protein n=1 Tax=Streptomyces sp. MZ04 TaxID=2559236 RepID=UPI0032AF7519
MTEPCERLIGDVVRRGIARGETRSEATGERVVDVIPAMMMYLHKVGGRDVEEKDMVKVVDQLMLPLLRPRG